MVKRQRNEGNVFRMPPRRPRPGINPMEDPVEWSLKFRRDGRPGPRARDRVEFDRDQIRRIRGSFQQTRAQFARMLGISKETLRNWERGRRFPQGPARALLRIAAANPDVVAAVLVRERAAWARAWIDPYLYIED
jgi:hypothetical protein